MIAYWIMVLLATAFMSICIFFAKNADKTTYSIPRYNSIIRLGAVGSALIYISFTGFRQNVGTDYNYTYLPYFHYVYSTGNPGRMEYGFYLLNYIVSRFTSNPTPVFLVCSIIFFYCCYSVILRYSPDIVLSIYLLTGMAYVFVFMNTMRQMVAVSILLYGMKFIEDKQYILFISCVLLAGSFHSSSYIFLTVYLIVRIPYNFYVLMLAPMIGFVLKPVIVDILQRIISVSHYSNYVGSVFENKEVGFIVIALNLVIYYFSLLVPQIGNQNISNIYKIFVRFQLIAFIFSIISGSIVLSQRIRWIFGLQGFVLLPMALSMIDDKRFRTISIIFIIILYAIYIWITVGQRNANGVVPYDSVF